MVLHYFANDNFNFTNNKIADFYVGNNRQNATNLDYFAVDNIDFTKNCEKSI